MFWTVSLIETCKTDGGATPNVPCEFPFTFRGKIYEECTNDYDDDLWCSTATYKNGLHIRGHWGTCSPDCMGMLKNTCAA